LVSKQGSIDWMCLPRFDSPWVFGRLLDWDRGGFLQLTPTNPGASMFRQYRRDSNVIQTIWTLEHSRMRVVDFMPIALKGKKLKPPESLRLVRMLQPLAGRTEWSLTFKPRFDYGRQMPSLRGLRPGLLAAHGEDASVFLQFPIGATLELVDGTAVITGEIMPGHRAAILLHYAGARPVPAAISIDEAHALLHQTDDYWMDWLRATTYRGRFDEPLHRSALALKLMQYLPTGAFVAAPTSSLPESPGGSLNWDYRYSWIRDTSDLVNALGEMGFDDEADGFMRWVRAAHDRHPKDFKIVYRIDGDDRLPEFVLDELEGYRGSKPVRIGNAAVDQVQLDIYGELMQTAYTCWQSRKILPKPRREILLQVVDRILEWWEKEDSGIWEARRRPRRYLYSQVMLWVGLDRALKLDRSLRMGTARRAAATRTRARLIFFGRTSTAPYCEGAGRSRSRIRRVRCSRTLFLRLPTVVTPLCTRVAVIVSRPLGSPFSRKLPFCAVWNCNTVPWFAPLRAVSSTSTSTSSSGLPLSSMSSTASPFSSSTSTTIIPQPFSSPWLLSSPWLSSSSATMAVPQSSPSSCARARDKGQADRTKAIAAQKEMKTLRFMGGCLLSLRR